MMGKGYQISTGAGEPTGLTDPPKLGMGDQIPASNGEGQLDPFRAVAVDTMVSLVGCATFCPALPQKCQRGAYQWHPQPCHPQPKGLGDARTGVSKRIRALGARLGLNHRPVSHLGTAAASGWTAPISAPLFPLEINTIDSEETILLFFFSQRKKSNINIRV